MNIGGTVSREPPRIVSREPPRIASIDVDDLENSDALTAATATNTYSHTDVFLIVYYNKCCISPFFSVLKVV